MNVNEEDHIDRFAKVVKDLEIDKDTANRLANFIHYEVMTAKAKGVEDGKDKVFFEKLQKGMEELGEERFLQCVGAQGLESIQQINKLSDLIKLVNVILAEINTKRAMVKTKEVKKEAVTEVRFVDNKDNTITDRKTGLIIIQDPMLLEDVFKKIMTFQEAEKACAKLDFGGHKDWWLPTIEELCGMVDRTKRNPCYDTNIFKGKFNDWYWSKENCVWDSGSAWCVDSNFGYVYSNLKNDRNYARPVVRSSQ